MAEKTMLTHLNILTDGLKRKVNALENIASICENQRTVIESELPLEKVREMIFGMNEEKQDSIQIVKDCDAMFEKMLADIGTELEAQQHLYKPQVKIMQENIRRVMSIDVKIRVAEDENNKLLDARRSAELPAAQNNGIKPKVTMPTNAAKVVDAYKQGKTIYKG
ncbi:MAG: hypothetical protein FWC70_04695 [Defluviitaleaceae bacterium]|nr:hypothetical protein [Defluviitaleaceae bacterium]